MDNTHPRPARQVERGPASFAMLAGGALLAAAVLNIWTARRAERRHPPSGKFVAVEGVRLHYIEQGEGPAVVFLHGNGAVAQDWEISDVLRRTADAGFRAIAFDRPGFGWSQRPKGRRFMPEEQARLVRRACLRLGIDRPVIVAQSWGTLVAAALALDEPNYVRGLVLIGGYYFPVPRADIALFSLPAIPIFGDVMRYTISPIIGRLIAKPLYRKIFGPRPVSRRFAAEFPLAMALRPWQIRATAADTAAMIPAASHLQSRYFAISLPVAIIAGAGDQIADPRVHSARLHRQLPNSALHIVPGGGHMVHHLVPQQVVERIQAVSAEAEHKRPTEASMPG